MEIQYTLGHLKNPSLSEVYLSQHYFSVLNKTVFVTWSSRGAIHDVETVAVFKVKPKP